MSLNESFIGFDVSARFVKSCLGLKKLKGMGFRISPLRPQK